MKRAYFDSLGWQHVVWRHNYIKVLTMQSGFKIRLSLRVVSSNYIITRYL